ncbi:HEAT repeat domain-containing protein [Citricoccus sp. NPDC055426]|uniref:HEAT repeat domain-containing protein n=1 Tax=Citricoccus sp. NPDC055426 TaxID=3155536 RepID=UPI00343ECFA8
MDHREHEDRGYWDVSLPAAAEGADPTWVTAAVEQVGGPQLADWAVRLLTGRARPGDPGDPDIALIRGEVTDLDPELVLDPHLPRWLGARVLQYHWHPRAAQAVLTALTDESPAVRQACCRIVAVQGTPALADAAATVESLLVDPEPRVRSAAALALGEVGGERAATALQGLLMDPDSVLAAAAEDALGRLAERHSRPDLRAEPEY